MADETIIPIKKDSGKDEINPHGLIEAISYIEQQYSNECGGAETRGGLFTTKQRWEFMEVGFKGSLLSGLVLALMTPFAVGVFEHCIPIFGEDPPTLFDQVFAFMLSVGFSLCYAIFIAQVSMKWRGGYTKRMVLCLMQGLIVGTAIKAAFTFLLFYFIYIKLLTDGPLFTAAETLMKWGLSQERVLDTLQWVMSARHVVLTSAWMVLFTSFATATIPLGAYFYAKRRNKKLVEMGVCPPPIDD